MVKEDSGHQPRNSKTAVTLGFKVGKGDPWVKSGELRRILREASTDSGLLDDLADIREAELND